MKIEFCREPDAREISVRVCAPELTPEVEALMHRISQPFVLPAYSDRGEVMLEMHEIVRVYTEKRRVLVESVRGTFALRMRIYELEEKLDPVQFIRISNSEIVSRRCIRSLDFSLSGTIRLSLKGGSETYVSRRYVSRIRKAFEN